jgi:hypothetical protein
MGKKKETEKFRQILELVSLFGDFFSSPKLWLQNPSQWSYSPFDALSRPCARNPAMAFAHSALCWCCCWLLARAIEEGGDATEGAWIFDWVSREGIPFCSWIFSFFFSRKMSDCAPCCCVWADFGELIRARRRREESSQGEREGQRDREENLKEFRKRLRDWLFDQICEEL